MAFYLITNVTFDKCISSSLRRRLLSKLRLKNTRQINMSDNECDYDSTWEDEHENKTPKKKLFRNDEKVKKKLVKSYKLMLDFYGIHLVDQSTGEVARASNWEQRFRHLNRHTHNNLRITRILKCLGTLGLEHYQAPLVRFFLHETLENGNLPNVKHSVLDYFMFAVLDKLERRELVKYAFKHFKPQKHFVWGPKKILSAQVVHYKKEKVDQPTESKQSRTPEDQQKRVLQRRSQRKIYAAKDMQNFRHSCRNLDGYKDDHDKPGQLFRKDKQLKSKLVKSYKLMLDFYGIRLVNESTGEVACASNWEQRFRNLNRYSNNNLRITRILKCLGTLGLEHYQAPLVKFYLQETLVKGQLQNVKQSVLDYFMFAILDKSERRELIRFAFNHFKPQEQFVWGPKKILSGQVVHYKKENMDQPKENKQSGIAEDQKKRVKLHESKHKMKKKKPLKFAKYPQYIDMESDEECEFDSTWEDEYENKTPRKKVLDRMSRRNMNAAKDMQDFRHSYQSFDDHDEPYKLFRKDNKAKSKLVKSYKLMLDFYGLRLVDESTGEVEHAPNWRDRFRNLNRVYVVIYSHNNLRITRILKCLGTLGLEHYQAPLVKFFLHETLVVGHLQSLKQSVLLLYVCCFGQVREAIYRMLKKIFKPDSSFIRILLTLRLTIGPQLNRDYQNGSSIYLGKDNHR
ncbi:opioid growth factor receptor-like protein [Labeo rohita]|uniref:Opioid growth factor receptor-like protein n=1 Tax=Labeo rohita TaxID=84645 RepID=A0A498L7I8_LABRO|nr:opioid growth factor receptor-like protein [Labeo rohita]